MLAAARRARIVDLVRHEEAVQTEQLAQTLDVSVETVRRDLEHLERAGSLQRVRGGAVRTPTSLAVEPPFDARTSLAADQKAAIGKAGARLMQSARTVFLDIGTTAAAVARAIDPHFSGTIVTPSMRIAELLVGHRDLTVLVPGGRLRSGDLSISGPTARQFLSDIYPDVAFIGTGAVDVDAGLTDFEIDEVEIKRVVIANSDRCYALADSTKVGARAPYRVCDLADVDAVVCDDAVPDAERDRFAASGVELIVG